MSNVTIDCFTTGVFQNQPALSSDSHERFGPYCGTSMNLSAEINFEWWCAAAIPKRLSGCVA